MRIGSNRSETNHPGFLPIEHRGEPITFRDLALIAESLPRRGPLNKWQQALTLVGGGLLLAACTPGLDATTPTPTRTAHPTETPHIDPTPTALRPISIELTRTPFVTQVPETIITSPNNLLPGYVSGQFDELSLPDEIEQISLSSTHNDLTAHSLVPVEDGQAAAYQGVADNVAYAATLAEIIDRQTGQTLKFNGIDKEGIGSYVSEDGLTIQYFIARMPCASDKQCLTAISFNKADAGVLYWLQIDEATGQIEKSLPAIYGSQTELKHAIKGGLKPLEKGQWDTALHGAAAIAQAGSVMGLSYEAGDGATGEDGLMFMVEENGKNVVEQASNKNITYKDEILSATNENGIFVWDQQKNDWTQAVPETTVQDGAPVYQVGDTLLATMDGNLQIVTLGTTEDGASLITVNGIEHRWDGEKWVLAQEEITLDDWQNQILTGEIEQPWGQLEVNRYWAINDVLSATAIENLPDDDADLIVLGKYGEILVGVDKATAAKAQENGDTVTRPKKAIVDGIIFDLPYNPSVRYLMQAAFREYKAGNTNIHITFANSPSNKKAGLRLSFQFFDSNPVGNIPTVVENGIRISPIVRLPENLVLYKGGKFYLASAVGVTDPLSWPQQMIDGGFEDSVSIAENPENAAWLTETE